MSNKVAKFVEVTITARVIVDENATEEQILEAAKKRIQYKALNEYSESGVKVYNDEDCPYDPTDPEDNPNVEEFVRNFGLTDKNMATVLKGFDFKDVDNEFTMAECARNCGFIYSFVHKRWFDKNYRYTEQEEAILEMVKAEPEHQI